MSAPKPLPATGRALLDLLIANGGAIDYHDQRVTTSGAHRAPASGTGARRGEADRDGQGKGRDGVSKPLRLVADNPSFATFEARGGIYGDLIPDLRAGRVKMWSAWDGTGYYEITDAGRAALARHDVKEQDRSPRES